jgi:DNA mismatch repair protein MutS2
MAPTYRLQLGFAGASSAIELAARMGLPDRITARARHLALHAGGPLAQALAAAEEERKRLAVELARARKAAAASEAERAALEREREAARREQLESELRHREAMAAEMERAAAEARAALGELRAREKSQEAARLEREIAARAADAERRAAEARTRVEPEAAPELAGELRVGGMARHSRLNQRVEVLEIADDTALVAAGAIKMRAPVAELVPIAGEGAKGRFPGGSDRAGQLERARKAAPAPVRSPANRIDVRGLRAEEALARVEQFLDRAFADGGETVTILHGHGTGALKQTIREYLDRSAYVRMFRPGSDEEGGDGVTVVALRS